LDQGKLVLEKADHVHEHVHDNDNDNDNVNVNLGEHVLVDYWIDRRSAWE